MFDALYGQLIVVYQVSWLSYEAHHLCREYDILAIKQRGKRQDSDFITKSKKGNGSLCNENFLEYGLFTVVSEQMSFQFFRCENKQISKFCF